MYKIIYICRTCENLNKHHRGKDGFVEQQTDFEEFSAAWNHMDENKHGISHFMESVLVLLLTENARKINERR